MASKRRIRRNQCGSKIKYDTAQQATHAACCLARKKGEIVQSYRCDFCNGYHIGHPNKKMKMAKARRLGI